MNRTNEPEQIEARGWEDLYTAVPQPAAREMGLAIARIDGVLALRLAALPHPMFNRAIGLGVSGGDHATIDRLRAWFGDAGVTAFALPLAPSAQLASLAEALTARGATVAFRYAKMVRDDSPAPAIPDGLTVTMIGPERADEFADVLSRGYGTPKILDPMVRATVARPGWRHYLVGCGGTSIGCGALFLDGERAWCGIAATLPEHRRRGAQSALFAARIRDAIAAGARRLFTETAEDLPDDSNPSFRNMVRAGFSVAYFRPNYLLTTEGNNLS